MSIRVGINGFGRMGRLALRAGWGAPDLAWYDNEIGYVHRMLELLRKVGQGLR
jgi:glyceraldehyde-3-phosphate dehydrogenase/erythrose-4-phosphate dehydrogenase